MSDTPSEPDASVGPSGGIEDVLGDRGPAGTTPAPDPLKHASPYVDQAKLAEAGLGPVEDDGAGVERPSGALGYDASDADGLESADRADAEHQRPRRGRVLGFMRNSAEELKRVQWPTRRQTGQGTAVVLGFVVLAGGFLGLMDALWKPIVEAII